LPSTDNGVTGSGGQEKLNAHSSSSAAVLLV
jgi:hypothetical protein